MIEALNYSNICIASNCKHGPSEILKKGKYGFIFNSRSHNDLFQKLVFAEKNKKKCSIKIRNGKSGLKRFLIKNQSAKYFNMISKICKKH